MNAHASAQHYRQTAVQSAVLEASPHRLVELLLEGLRQRLQRAIACIDVGDIPRKGDAIRQASAIIAELNGSLDLDAGGEIATGLSALYDYAQRRLVEANLHNDPAILRELDGLFAEIESAWRAIAPKTP
jgi:flagellar protein FliS